MAVAPHKSRGTIATTPPCLKNGRRGTFSNQLRAYSSDPKMQAVLFEDSMTTDYTRSGCPINLTLEALGDRWSLVIIRDMMFGNRRHFREMLTQSEEGIASNILANRLKRLSDGGFITRADDPSHKQKAIYSLTEKAIQLVPLLAAMGAWGRRHTPVTKTLSIRAEILERGGLTLWNAFMDELREMHLKIPRPATGPKASDQMRDAYLAALKEEG